MLVERITARLRGAVFAAWVSGVFLMGAAWVRVEAQDPARDFLPEIDVHVGLNEHARFLFQFKDDREGGEPLQATIGPTLQLFRKPLLNIKNLVVLELDTTKSRILMVETGYRVITAPGAPAKNRLIEAATFRIPLLHDFVVANRDRIDLDWQNGAFTWRFRNKLALAHVFRIRSYPIVPYAAWEPFYLSKYGKFSSTDLYGGMAFPAGKHIAFDVYYEHENDTGESPNSQKNYVGLALHLFFNTAEKVKH
jgi:hypothetical protein